jgi:tetratricopeptide (TPR) repeat protein
MGEVYRSMEDYTNALSYYRRTLEIEEKHLSTNHPSLAITVSNMAVALDANKQYQAAFEHTERALDIFCHAFGPTHSQTKQNQIYLNEIRQKLLSVE